ncbi:tetraspanin-14-like [Cimex lectularius]|uniref:Tetraspanin n=1 Tax=Cimex lectularius TaxID=79782 RepID=A0A8I6TBL2_CIMLE|nr:tetraspanin-14-like [Cimex lectularius]
MGKLKRAYFLIAIIVNGLLGIGIIVIGSRKMNDALLVKAFLVDQVLVVKGFISVGIVLFVISIVGIVGVISKSDPLFKIYACFMLVLALTQIAIGSIMIIRVKDFRHTLNKALEENFRTYDEHKIEMDQFQLALLCCGIWGAKKWDIAELPSSCCGRETGTCSVSSAYSSSCSDKAGSLIENGLYLMSIFSFVLVLLDIQCVFLSCCLSKFYVRKIVDKFPRDSSPEEKKSHSSKLLSPRKE